jgi:hypothetical protein
MTRALWTLCAVACCLGLIALTAGCRKQEAARGSDLQAARPTADETAYLGRGENLFEKGQTKYFPVHFIDAEALTIHDKWQPAARDGGGADDGGAADADDADTIDEGTDAKDAVKAGGDLAYYIGEERFENVAKLVSHLDQLDDEALQNGLVLVQDGAESRPDWEQDITQLCTFAEFKNTSFWFRVPTEAPTPESEHAYWLVSQTTPPQSSPSTDAVSRSRQGG